MRKTFHLLLAAALLGIPALAQDATLMPKPKKISFTGGIEGNLLQVARFTTPATGLSTIPRYTYFFNSGIDADLRLSNNLSPFSGLHLKNIGLIVRHNDSTLSKHRVYTLGVPIGIKYYSNDRKLMLKAGADLGLALNYKWKVFVNDTKTKTNEFFSNRTSPLFASAFAGIAYRGFSVTGNFYFNDFFTTSGYWWSGFNARLITLGLGFSLDDEMFKPKKKN